MTAADLVGTATDSALATALAAFQGEMPTVPKAQTANAGTYSYKYASLADVAQAAYPILAAHGLSFSCVPRWTEHGQELVGVLMHSSGESMEGHLPIGGANPQALGSSISYARRYLFGAMTGVVTDDDDDGRAASATPAKRAAPRKKTEPAEDPAQRAKDMRNMFALMRELGIIHGGQSDANKAADKANSLAYVTNVIKRPIESRANLTDAELSNVINALQTKGADDFRPKVVAPETPVDPWATTPGTRESAGPPDPADPDAEYLAARADEAKQVVSAAVGEDGKRVVRGPVVDPEDVPLPIAVPVAPDTTPVAPPVGISPGTVKRVDNLLIRELGDIATADDKQALMSAILDTPVTNPEHLTRPQSLSLAEAFDHFRDGTWSWEFDRADTSPTPRIIVTRDQEAPDAPG